MGLKVTFDYANRLVIPNGPLVTGSITINVQTDIYSDGKEDWLTGSTLPGFYFPVEAIGGQEVSAGVLGTTYLLTHGWHIRPYEANHNFYIEGNIYTDDGSPLVQPTLGAYNVPTSLILSTLVEVVEVNTGSGLTTDEHNTLYNRSSQVSVDAVQADTDNIQTRLPAALVGGRIDSYVGAIDTAVLAQIADAILIRNIGTGSNGGRTVQDALRMLRNHRQIVGNLLTVYTEDDVSVAWTAAVALAARNPLQGVDPT